MAACGPELDAASPRLVLGMIARLKYPEPSQPVPQWEAKLQRRVRYIEVRLQRAAKFSKVLHPTAAAVTVSSRG